MTEFRAARVGWLRNNGLTLALMVLFLASLTGQILTGWRVEVADLRMHGAPPDGLGRYLLSGAFLSALFENWESEFLQMWVYVTLTAYLFQRGSPESKDPDTSAPQDADPAATRRTRHVPYPVRRGGLLLRLYSHSLGAALLALFVLSFVFHWLNSARAAANEARQHGEAAASALGYLGEPQLWFESFQNWQSEFLSTAVLVVLGIWLRERGSPESKAMADPHDKTGT